MLRTIGRRLALPAAAIFLAVALAGPTTVAHAELSPPERTTRPTGALHTAPKLRTVATFDPSRGELAESVVAAPDGTLYVSTIAAATIQVIAPDGARSTIAVPLGPGGQLGTLALGRSGLYASSFTPAALWYVPIPQRGHPAQPVSRLASLPDGASPNGITFDRAGNLYAADSTQGLIWRLTPDANTATVWLRDRLLVPDQDAFPVELPFPVPGANGIKLFRGHVYVSNSSTATIVRIPLRRDGSPGKPTVAHRGVVADDFAFDRAGNLYAAGGPTQTLTRVHPNGRKEVLLDPTTGLSGATAVAFGTTPRTRTTLYITENAFLGFPQPVSALRRITLTIPGALLPLGP